MSDMWTCDDCGMVHSHARHLHTLWNEMEWSKVKKLQFNPDCNCGAREAHEREFHELDFPAPVPESVLSEIENNS